MKDALHRRHRAALTRFVAPSPAPGERAVGPVLLAFDYDGVLAPLVKEPSGARMRPRTRTLLARLERLYPVAVVSGRAWKDVAAFMDGLSPTIVGNHGFELGRPAPVPASVLREVRGWRRRLERALDGVPGIHFEDKRSTLAVHYGLSRTWRSAERAVYEAANQLEGTRLIAGKKVLNVLPHDFPTKGDAVRALVARLGAEGAVYVGDDVTDEDAFAVGAPLVFGVHVGKGPSLAPWRVAQQRDVDRLLELLIDLAEGRGEAAPPLARDLYTRRSRAPRSGPPGGPGRPHPAAPALARARRPRR